MNKLIAILVSLSILITGCWDKVEINKRIFVISMGIDKFEGQQFKSRENEIFQNLIPDRYKITFTYPNLALIVGDGAGEATHKITSTGININDIQKNLNTHLEGVISFDHIKLIVLGEEMAKDEELMKEVLDFIERSPEIGRRIHLMVAPGEAADILSTKLPQPIPLGLYVRDLMNKPTRAARSADADIGYILRNLHESDAAIVPRINSSKNEIVVAGAAVIKNHKMAGWLGEMETLYLMFMLDKVDTATGNVIVDKRILPILVSDSTTKMTVSKKEGRIHVAFNIEAEGSITQHGFALVGQTFDPKYIRRVEKDVEERLEKNIARTYKIIREKFGADLIQAGEYLRKKDPKVWDEVKDNWEEYFTKSQSEVNVRMKIRRVGVTR